MNLTAGVAAVQAPEVTIGSYRILKVIGTGGMGTVYLGEHTLLGRQVAIKVLLPSLSADPEIVKRFFDEARIVAMITDPGIVQVFDFGYHADGRACIIMELLHGESVARRLRRVGAFGTLECLRLVRLICISLGVAHAQGIVHRDLKPANIFIVGDAAVPGGERAKVLDFGIAKQAGDAPGRSKTRTGVLMGTPMYMSPEQCRAEGPVDARSDIYSLACVMFTMLTGQPPFGWGAPGDLVAAHLREPPPFAGSRVPGLPRVIDEILQRCLQKTPAERFSSMVELAQAIGRVEESLFGASAPRLAIEPAGRYRRAGAAPPVAELGPAMEPDRGSPAVAATDRDGAMVGPDRGNAVLPSRGDRAFHAGLPALQRVSGTARPPAAAAEPTRRRQVTIIMAAAICGCLGAVLLSRVGREDERVPVSSPIAAATSTAGPSSAPADPPERNAKPGTGGSDPAIPNAGSATHAIPDAGSATAAIPDAGSATPATPGSGDPAASPRTPPAPAAPLSRRARTARQPPQPAPKDEHANQTGSATQPASEPTANTPRSDAPDEVDRGD